MKRNSFRLSRLLLSTISVMLLALLFSCSKTLTANADSLYVPTAADVTANATLADLQAGRSLFVANCGKCHSYYAPDSYSAASWRNILPNMASRAGLSAAETTLVTKYVTRGQ
ncbi:MAG: hypothetical protein LWW85_14485 [Marinilabiliales bacterium]|nr:hypothetical protein [Marinilabiliales bacterium]